MQSSSTPAPTPTPRTPRDVAEEHGASRVLELLTQHAAAPAAPGGSGAVQLLPEAAFESWFESTSSRSSVQVEPAEERSSRHRAFESTRTSSQVDVGLHLARISSATRHTTQDV